MAVGPISFDVTISDAGVSVNPNNIGVPHVSFGSNPLTNLNARLKFLGRKETVTSINSSSEPYGYVNHDIHYRCADGKRNNYKYLQQPTDSPDALAEKFLTHLCDSEYRQYLDDHKAMTLGSLFGENRFPRARDRAFLDFRYRASSQTRYESFDYKDPHSGFVKKVLDAYLTHCLPGLPSIKVELLVVEENGVPVVQLSSPANLMHCKRIRVPLSQDMPWYTAAQQAQDTLREWIDAAEQKKSETATAPNDYMVSIGAINYPKAGQQKAVEWGDESKWGEPIPIRKAAAGATGTFLLNGVPVGEMSSIEYVNTTTTAQQVREAIDRPPAGYDPEYHDYLRACEAMAMGAWPIELKHPAAAERAFWTMPTGILSRGAYHNTKPDGSTPNVTRSLKELLRTHGVNQPTFIDAANSRVVVGPASYKYDPAKSWWEVAQELLPQIVAMERKLNHKATTVPTAELAASNKELRNFVDWNGEIVGTSARYDGDETIFRVDYNLGGELLNAEVSVIPVPSRDEIKQRFLDQIAQDGGGRPPVGGTLDSIASAVAASVHDAHKVMERLGQDMRAGFEQSRVQFDNLLVSQPLTREVMQKAFELMKPSPHLPNPLDFVPAIGDNGSMSEPNAGVVDNSTKLPAISIEILNEHFRLSGIQAVVKSIKASPRLHGGYDHRAYYIGLNGEERFFDWFQGPSELPEGFGRKFIECLIARGEMAQRNSPLDSAAKISDTVTKETASMSMVLPPGVSPPLSQRAKTEAIEVAYRTAAIKLPELVKRQLVKRMASKGGKAKPSQARLSLAEEMLSGDEGSLIVASILSLALSASPAFIKSKMPWLDLDRLARELRLNVETRIACAVADMLGMYLDGALEALKEAFGGSQQLLLAEGGKSDESALFNGVPKAESVGVR